MNGITIFLVLTLLCIGCSAENAVQDTSELYNDLPNRRYTAMVMQDNLDSINVALTNADRKLLNDNMEDRREDLLQSLDQLVELYADTTSEVEVYRDSTNLSILLHLADFCLEREKTLCDELMDDLDKEVSVHAEVYPCKHSRLDHFEYLVLSEMVILQVISDEIAHLENLNDSTFIAFHDAYIDHIGTEYAQPSILLIIEVLVEPEEVNNQGIDKTI